MDDGVILGILTLEILLGGGFYLLLPRIARRGLLFGVYVGEEAAAGEPARAIARAWTRGMLVCTAAALVLGPGLGKALGEPLVGVAGVGLLGIGSLGLYLRAHGAARRLAPQDARAPLAVAVLAEPGPSSWLPHATLGFAVAAALAQLAYAAAAYPALPERIPTHFTLSGVPDGWSAKSFESVLFVPVLALIQGLGLGLLCVFTSQAKLAVRSGDAGRSLAAQNAFRTATTRFLCGVTAMVAVLLLGVSVSSIRVGLGRAERLLPGFEVFLVLMLVFVLGGALRLALRYGQGGARLERGAATAPLTDGLADNRHWILGMFYVNRDDPAVLVEHRFGLGYTLNFGNAKAVAVLVGFFVLLLGVALAAVLVA